MRDVTKGLFVVAVTMAMTSEATAQLRPTELRAAALDAENVARLVTSASDTECEVALMTRTSDERIVAHRGPGSAAATIAAGHGVFLIAMIVEDVTHPFRVRVARKEGARLALSPVVNVARSGARHDVAFNVSAASVPDGFAVFFQETSANDATEAHTYLARIDVNGEAARPAAEVAIPWTIGASAWNGAGFHLGLLYPGGNGMRLSMVSTSEAGAPQQHPDWASAEGIVADVHLATYDGKVFAYFRSGAGATSREVTAIGSWGEEPRPSRNRGAIARGEVIVLVPEGEREPRIARARLRAERAER